MPTLSLKPVDSIEATVLIDNFVDALAASSEHVHRAPLPYALVAPDVEHLRAEHGYSLLVTVTAGGNRTTILYDAGLTPDSLIHNLDVLQVSPKDIRTIVLSHGHGDHHGGLEGIVERIGRSGLPLVLHPDAWMHRRVVFPTGAEIALPPPSLANLEGQGVEVLNERGPTLLVDGHILVSGQTERTTEFEKGFPPQQKRSGDHWEPDPWIWDDQSIIVNVAGRGLVILSGCSHSGIINVIRHARALTGEQRIHAFMGGFHLTGGLFEQIIDPTIDALVEIAPDYVVPGHCTGFRATNQVVSRLPEAYLLSSVGTTFVFAKPD